MKQTAVEFLVKELRLEDTIYIYTLKLIEQAKEMEKQQIIDAYKKAHEDGYHFEGSASDYEAEGLEEYLSEQYYNETFKNK